MRFKSFEKIIPSRRKPCNSIVVDIKITDHEDQEEDAIGSCNRDPDRKPCRSRSVIIKNNYHANQ